MDEVIKNLIKKISDSVINDEFIDIAEEVIEEIEQRPDRYDAIEPIFKLMENNPEVDFGKPGPLVHFLEKFYQNGYEEKLVESLHRRPIKHTIWMLNRIINGSDGDKRKYFLNLLEKIIVSPNLDDSIVLLARHFRSLHFDS